MSDSYFYSSRTPTPHNRHGSHHHASNSHRKKNYHNSRNKKDNSSDSGSDSVLTIKQKRRKPLESSPFTFFFIIILCIFIQIMFLDDFKLEMTRPDENELPLAYRINKIFDAIPTFSFMTNYSYYPKEILLISFIIFLIYRILCSTSRSPFSSFLISIMFLFDKTTYNLIVSNPSFGVQLILISNCIINCQKLLVIQIFSSSWITRAVVNLLLGFFATFISIETYTIFIPIVTSIILLSRSTQSKDRTSFCTKIFNAIVKSIYLIILCCVCFAITFIVYFLIGPPKFTVVSTNPTLLFAELLSNNHNISFLFMAPFVLILYFFTDIEFSWLLSFIGCLVFTIFLMFSSIVNDLQVQAALCVYYYLLCCGFIFTNPKVSTFSAFLLILELALVIYFYAFPI